MKLLNFIKRNIVFIMFLIIIFFLLTYKLPYYIDAPGGLININKRINIDSSYDVKGSFNMAYVNEINATIPYYLIAKINDKYDIIKKNEVVNNNETIKESNLRGHLMLKEANDNAIILAYKKANKTINIKDSKILITYIDELAKTNLKIGDQIIKVNDITVDNKEQIKNIIYKYDVGDDIKFTVIRNGKKLDRKAKIVEYKGNRLMGLILTYKRVLEPIPNIDIKNKKREYGSSGGLITSLAIYNFLTKDDITCGKKIVGTGTIEEDGKVGEIGGIKHKLIGAVKNKADLFFVPKENYKEALKYKKLYNYDIKIKAVSTFDEALNYLKKCD